MKSISVAIGRVLVGLRNHGFYFLFTKDSNSVTQSALRTDRELIMIVEQLGLLGSGPGNQKGINNQGD